MGQSADAAASFRTAAELLLRRGDHSDARALVDRALHIDSADQAALALKARIWKAAGQDRQAEEMLQSLPAAEDGGEISAMLVDLYLDSGELDRAAALARRIFAKDSKNYRLLEHVAAALLDHNQPGQALEILQPAVPAVLAGGDHDRLADLLNRAAEALPGRIEPRQLLVEIYRHTSDSFRLPPALIQLAEACENAGQLQAAIETYAQFLERDPENDSVRRKLQQLQLTSGVSASPPGAAPLPEFPEPPATPADARPPDLSAAPPDLDPETQIFVNQAITDVDLYSSYGLTEKAIELLEAVIQRVPQHIGALERLLDLSVGLNDDQRTLQLSAQLEQIYDQMGDRPTADRFADLRRRFERAAAAQAPCSQNPPPAPEPLPVPAPAASVPPMPSEFEIPVVEATPVEPCPAAPPGAGGLAVSEPVVHEVDLSEEWAALNEHIETPQVQTSQAQPADPAPATEPGDRSTAAGSPPDFTEASFDSLLDDYPLDKAIPPSFHAAPPLPPSAPPTNPDAKAGPAPAPPHSSANGGHPLANLLEELRADFEDDSKTDDPESHYNLGIAYREMGLLEEAISEFQRAAAAFEKGAPFAYAMQCFTLLAATFKEKNQPAIAVHWYERALQLPDLDPETLLALRYDLGVAQELAGDVHAAHSSFLKVYGANIDYRDVAERLASLARPR